MAARKVDAQSYNNADTATDVQLVTRAVIERKKMQREKKKEKEQPWKKTYVPAPEDRPVGHSIFDTPWFVNQDDYPASDSSSTQ